MKKHIELSAGRQACLHRQGFTIIELLIYCGILTIFLYVMTNIFTAVLDMQLETQTSSAETVDSRYILSRFAYDIGRASAIITPAALGEQTSDLALTIDGVQYSYTVADGDLILTTPVGSGTLNSYATSISNVTFRRYGNVDGKHSVRITFTLTSIVSRVAGPEVRDFETTIGLR
jgi:hypothetical protein